MLEAGTSPELKEGLYIGEEIPEDHPYFLQKKINSGPNQWPQGIEDKDEFEKTTMEYYNAVSSLSKDVLSVLALTLNVESNYFDPLTDGKVATMRYLHYPAQPKDADEKLSRGIGAHTDFGIVTLLLQDEVDGLQVLDAPTGQWLDVSIPSRCLNNTNITRSNPYPVPTWSIWATSSCAWPTTSTSPTPTASSTSLVASDTRFRSSSAAIQTISASACPTVERKAKRPSIRRLLCRIW